MAVEALCADLNTRPGHLHTGDIPPIEGALFSQDTTPRTTKASFTGAEAVNGPETALPPLRPMPLVMGISEFEEAAASGQLLAVHVDMFVHPMVARKHAVTQQSLQEVINQGGDGEGHRSMVGPAGSDMCLAHAAASCIAEHPG